MGDKRKPPGEVAPRRFLQVLRAAGATIYDHGANHDIWIRRVGARTYQTEVSRHTKPLGHALIQLVIKPLGMKMKDFWKSYFSEEEEP